MQATCQECEGTFEAQRKTAKYCTKACSQRATRKRAAAAENPPPASPPPGTPSAEHGADGMPLLVAATLDELVKAGRLDTALGQAALVLAAKAGSRADTGSATASVVRELRATLQAALDGAATLGDPLDELRSRRDRKRTG